MREMTEVLRTNCSPVSKSGGQGGFSLLSVLFLSAIVATAFMVMANFVRESDEIERARASGWQLVQVSKAARLYVRNNSVTDPTGAGGAVGDLNGDGIADSTYAYPSDFGDGLGGVFPQEITISTLVNAGLLPQGFRNTNSLGQDVRIVVANYPPAGNPLDPGTVVSAYVVLMDSVKSTPRLMQYVADAAKENNFPVSAPTFNSAGVPINDCDSDGQPDVVIWDSGCISLAEIALLYTSSSMFPVPFPYEGSLIVPAWRSMPHDTRAVMRYRQTENPNVADMMTNVAFGHERTDAAGNCVQPVISLLPVPSGAGGYISAPTGLCSTDPDDSTAVTQRDQDQRVDIIGTPTLQVSRLVLSDQTAPGAEVSYSVDGSGNFVRNPDGDTTALGLRNPQLPAGSPSEVLGVHSSFSSGKAVHVIAPAGSVGPAAYFADATGTIPGRVVLENNLVISDGNPLTDENLSVNTPLSVGDIAVNEANTTDTLVVGGNAQFEQISVTNSLGTSFSSSVVAQNVTIQRYLRSNTVTAQTMTWNTISANELIANSVTGNSISAGNAGVEMLTTGALSLGQVNLLANGPDLSVDVY